MTAEVASRLRHFVRPVAWRLAHAALYASAALLAAVFILGQLMYSESVMDVVAGESGLDGPSGYSQFIREPRLGNPFTGHAIHVFAVYEADTWGVGETVAEVALFASDLMLADAELVVDDHLDFESTSIRLSGTGIAAIYSVEASSGVQVGRIPFLLELSADSKPVEHPLRGETGLPLAVAKASMPADRDPQDLLTPAQTSLIAIAAPGSEQFGAVQELALGDGIALAEGHLLRYVSSEEWTRVTVVHDPAKPYRSAAAALAAVCLAAVLLLRAREWLGRHRVQDANIDDSGGSR